MYATSAPRIIVAKHWKDVHAPTKEEWLAKAPFAINKEVAPAPAIPKGIPARVIPRASQSAGSGGGASAI